MSENKTKSSSDKLARALLIGLLVICLLAGAWLRFTHANWDENQHLHPDERFLTMVTSSIHSTNNLGEYFNTDKSPMNPSNAGYGFYVYGTLPIFIVRLLAEGLNQTGYDEVFLVGRVVSAIADLLTVLLVFVIAQKLFKRLSISVVAAGLSAFSVLQIQQAHFYTVDAVANLFLTLALLLLVVLHVDVAVEISQMDKGSKSWLLLFALFGVAAGMAAVSKISYAPVVLLLPLVGYLKLRETGVLADKRAIQAMVIAFIIAAIAFMITFRVLQPYAFTGPGLLNIVPSEKWLTSLKELSAMSKGEVDFPPALQWARRPLTFSLTNMVVWGMGIAWGVAAWVSYLWMGWKIWRQRWYAPLPVWLWTGFNFVMQSLNFTRSMRYQLPIYASLAVIAAWGLVSIAGLKVLRTPASQNSVRLRPLAFILVAFVLGYTGIYAYAFTGIYRRPVTRVEASRWIYQHVPAAINLTVKTESGEQLQPLQFLNAFDLSEDSFWQTHFIPVKEGFPGAVRFPYLIDLSGNEVLKTFVVKLCADAGCGQVLSEGRLSDAFITRGDARGTSYQVALPGAPMLKAGNRYYIHAGLNDSHLRLRMYGQPEVNVIGRDEEMVITLPAAAYGIQTNHPFETTFTPIVGGEVSAFTSPHLVDLSADSTPEKLLVTLYDQLTGKLMASARLEGDFAPTVDGRGDAIRVAFDEPANLMPKHIYRLVITNETRGSVVTFYGSTQAPETTWDDVLPVSLYGISPMDYNYGPYRSDLKLEMYWDDNVEKRERIASILDQSDYLFISSSRVWGSVVQIPERYPLSIAYYRHLAGCPEDKDTFACMSDLQPGQYQGRLGFDLVKVFQSEPCIGSLCVNSQYAEEAFNVYDHPKVFIFKKNDSYSREAVRRLLDAVDLGKVRHLTPKEASQSGGEVKTLMLTPEQAEKQRAGGTWSELFDRQMPYNKSSLLAAIYWYVSLFLIGLLNLPLVTTLFGRLHDAGYAVAKLFGLMLLGWLSWWGGSLNVPVTRLQISVMAVLVVILNIVLASVNFKSMRKLLSERQRLILYIEVVSLLTFIFFLLIRAGNPDLWHLYKGGEKPMDFSYLNAIIKSSVYPPYDPWFAGGYLNYYYYGFVIYGTLIKWLGIMPSTGYNLLLASVFSFSATLVFSLIYGFYHEQMSLGRLTFKFNTHYKRLLPSALVAAFGVLLVLVLGNFGSVRMIWQGLQKTNPQFHEGANALQQNLWAVSGLVNTITGQDMPYAPGDWYWIPSRAIPGDVITEFPSFTFLYADPHAHLMALPITLMVIYWAYGLLKRKPFFVSGRRQIIDVVLYLMAGGLIIGALKPTNTWDYYTYLILSVCVLGYTILSSKWAAGSTWHKLFVAIVTGSLLALFSSLFYTPFNQTFVQAYNSIKLWQGTNSPLPSLLVHWGYMLFIITSWLAWETRNWMAETPFTQLQPYLKHLGFLVALLVVVIGFILWQTLTGVSAVFLTIPLGLWTMALLFRKNQTDAQRFILFCTGTALMLILVVEYFYISGDIGRMNTVFKFYLQAWVLLGISSAAALGWMINAIRLEWKPVWRNAWMTVMISLTFGVGLFPVMAGVDKITDRIAPDAPHTLDGMAYMPYAKAYEGSVQMDLKPDNEAIRWMMDHVKGSPVIVEANVVEYHWGNRFTIYTGLPGVLGWNWHQRQQRAIPSSEVVTDRVEEIGAFYRTTDINAAVAFLKKYQVSYIIVGQLERIVYEQDGLVKFAQHDGELWDKVYENEQTAIYQVREQP